MRSSLAIFAMAVLFAVMSHGTARSEPCRGEVALEIRNPGLVAVPAGDGSVRYVVTCARCHKDPVGDHWKPFIEDREPVPTAQHTDAVQKSIFKIWQSFTVTCDGIDRTRLIIEKYGKDSHTDVSPLLTRLEECSGRFCALMKKPLTTEDQLLGESARIGLDVQKLYLKVQAMREERRSAAITACIVLGLLLVTVFLVAGLLSMYSAAGSGEEKPPVAEEGPP
ncbi:MAG: hypothetical protein RDV48_28945 [Candidatus Eremiobacteraeota bacterium]|nr:hypothetical protein [Candidatus Eremiobacteraeota bacterium]